MDILDEIVKFFEKYSIEKFKSRRKDNVLRFLKDYLDWNAVGEDIYCSKEDETGFKVGNILKNTIIKLLKVFPSIILNECKYKNKSTPNHWNLEQFHIRDVTYIIENEYNNFNLFYGNKTIKLFMQSILNKSNHMIELIHTIPIFMKIENNDSILNGNIYKSLLFNIFLCSIKSYIVISNELDTFSVEYRREIDEISVLNDDELNEIRRAQLEKRNKKVGEILQLFLKIFLRQKNKILNYSNDTIKYKILKAKEKEKEKIKNRLKNMTIEEREVEDYKKAHKLDNWNVGQTQGIFKYDQKTYYNELEDVLDDLKNELNDGSYDEVTEMRREIFGARMREMEDVYRQKEEEETFDLSFLAEDGEEYDDDDGSWWS